MAQSMTTAVARQWSGDALVPFRSSGSRAVPRARAVVPPTRAYHARSSRRSRRSNKRMAQTPEERTDAAVTVRVRRPCPGDLRVGLLGEGGALGKWDTSRVNPMRRSQSDPDLWEWVLAVPIGSRLQFKVVTIDAGDAVVRWSQGGDIVVAVPHGCTGVEVNVDWPEPRGGADARDAPLAVQQRVVVEKPIQDYRVETGGAWLAYGKVEKTVDDDDSDHDDSDHDESDADDADADDRIVVDAVDAVDIDADGGAAKGTAGAFVRADLSTDEDDEGDVDGDDEDDDVDDDDADDDAEGEDDGDSSTTSSGVDAESQSFSDAFAGGYVVGSHLEGMMGGKRTELVFNAADKEEHGVRVGIIEEDRLVELWHEHAAEPGKGMRVGDVYLGVVAKVISGMQGVLVDVTGKGPPYSLMQKGVDEPALAWVQSEEPSGTWDDDGDWENWDDDDADWDDDEVLDGDTAGGEAPGAREFATTLLEEGAKTRWQRRPAGGRWADAWADGVGVSGSYDGSVFDPGGDEEGSGEGSSDEGSSDEDDDDSYAPVDETIDEELQRHEATLEARRRDALRAKERNASRSVPAVGRSERFFRSEPSSFNSFNSSGSSRSPQTFGDSTAGGDFEEAYSSAWLRSGGGPRGATHHGWTPWKTHVAAVGRDSELTGANKVVEHWRPGMPVVVQVTRLGSGHKGPRVTARPTLPGRNVVLCPDGEGVYVSRKLAGQARAYVKAVGATVVPSDCALIMRTEAAGVSKEVLEMDIRSLADDWDVVRERARAAVEAAGLQGRSPFPRRLLDAATVEQILVRDLFGERIAKLTVDSMSSYEAIVSDLRRTGATDEIVRRVRLHTGPENVFAFLGVADAVESTADERVWLKDETLPGAHVVIQQTEALTAIDVNAGRAAFINDSDNESVAAQVNVAAAKEIALQLRLRDIGGLVMIDYIDMHDRAHRKEVETAFLEAAQNDRAQLTFLPISPLGVMEVARERLQGNNSGRRIVADIKGMPIDPDRPQGGPRRVRGPRPPPWAGAGTGRGRGRGRGGQGRGRNGYGGSVLGDRFDDFNREGTGGPEGNRRFRGWRERRTDDSPREREEIGEREGSYHSGSYYGNARRSSRGQRGRSST